MTWPVTPLDVEAPGADREVTAIHEDVDGLVGAGEDRLWRPGDVGLGLLAVGVEVLAEVAAAMGEGDGDHGCGGIGGGAQGIAGKDAQAAGVGGHGGREGDLHGEVGDGAFGEIWAGCGLVRKAHEWGAFLLGFSGVEGVGLPLRQDYRRVRWRSREGNGQGVRG